MRSRGWSHARSGKGGLEPDPMVERGARGPTRSDAVGDASLAATRAGASSAAANSANYGQHLRVPRWQVTPLSRNGAIVHCPPMTPLLTDTLCTNCGLCCDGTLF